MNEIWDCLNKSQSMFKKLYNVHTKVNAERLQFAVISVLQKDYPGKTFEELGELYEGINVKNGKNVRNPMRNKIDGICKIYEIIKRKKRSQFFKKIVAFLEEEMREDFVEGYSKIEDFVDDEMEMGDVSSDDEDDTNEEVVHDNSQFYVEGAIPWC